MKKKIAPMFQVKVYKDKWDATLDSKGMWGKHHSLEQHKETADRVVAALTRAGKFAKAFKRGGEDDNG